MPVSITPFSGDSEWHGCSWNVPSLDLLAENIARVAVGQAEHVALILNAAGIGPLPTTRAAIAEAVELLTAPATYPYHRDGWMFQVMSWLAALTSTPNGLIKTPQMILAEKGVDGLQIVLDSTGNVTAVVVFEDKATDNPRSTITNKVWPEFRALEKGKKQNLLAAEASTLLKAAQHPDPSTAIKEIVWNQARSYRVSISAEGDTAADRLKLFAGFADVAPGPLQRRRAETFCVSDLRTWMATLANLAIAKAQAMEVTDV